MFPFFFVFFFVFFQVFRKVRIKGGLADITLESIRIRFCQEFPSRFLYKASQVTTITDYNL